MRRWRGVIIPEGRETVDGRTVVKGAVSWDGAIRVVPQGSADVWRDADDLWAEGIVTGDVDPAWRPEADLVEVESTVEATVHGAEAAGPVVFGADEWEVAIQQSTIMRGRLVAVTFGEHPAWPDLPFEWLS